MRPVSWSLRERLMTERGQDATSVTTSKTVLFLLHINTLITSHEDPHTHVHAHAHAHAEVTSLCTDSLCAKGPS